MSSTSGFSIVIPARYAATRLPGKPLADLAGKPMIQRVYERASRSSAGRVLVATDDQRIFDVVKAFGGEVLMTRSDHPSGTDRLCEVAEKLQLDDEQVVVNLQGDEPEMPLAVLEQVAANLLANRPAKIATLCTPIQSLAELRDPNVVKVVRDQAGYALYFSRAPIPLLRADPGAGSDYAAYFPDPGAGSPAQQEAPVFLRHLGLYAYRAGALRDFVRWPVAPLEAMEKLEQLRAMSNGLRIHCDIAVEMVPPGIDSPQDLARARAAFSGD